MLESLRASPEMPITGDVTALYNDRVVCHLKKQ